MNYCGLAVVLLPQLDCLLAKVRLYTFQTQLGPKAIAQANTLGPEISFLLSTVYEIETWKFVTATC